MLNILAGYGFEGLAPAGAERLHLEVEAARLAYRDRDLLIGDPDHHPVPVEKLLSPGYAETLRRQIDPHRALGELPESPFPRHSDTTYITVVDRDRNAISFIGSLFHSFGSGIVGPESGVVLHNRGLRLPHHSWASQCYRVTQAPHAYDHSRHGTQGRADCLVLRRRGRPLPAPRACPYPLEHHRLRPRSPGGHRSWPRLSRGWVLQVERGISDRTAMDLAGYGHHVVRRAEVGDRDGGPIGAASIIKIDWESGLLIGGADARTDGCALGY